MNPVATRQPIARFHSVKNFPRLLLTVLPLAAGLVSCSHQVKARQPVSYHFEYGRSALLQGGLAYAPQNAPAAVKRAIAAGNRLQNKPYKWGGGHVVHEDGGYDCSGTVSYVLREAGLISEAIPSKGYFRYGEKGAGKWITLYIRNGHVFMTIAGLRLDTGGPGGRTGPQWKPQTRQGAGHVMRHPEGL